MLAMELSREEHYEVEVEYSDVGWCKYLESFSTLPEAEALRDEVKEISTIDPSVIGYRIVRCTAVREVVE